MIGARLSFLIVPRTAALAVALVAVQSSLAGLGRDPDAHLAPALPSEAHLALVALGLGLLALAPRLWRGTRAAVGVVAVTLVALAATYGLTGRYGSAATTFVLAAMLAGARSAFTLGCRNRPRLVAVWAALAAWTLAWCARRMAPLVRGHGRTVAVHLGAAHPHLTSSWISGIDVLIALAAMTSILAVRSLLRPAPAANGHGEHEYRAARAILERHGEDSLSPFLLRPDKGLHFAAGGVLAYRVIHGTAIVSADPVAPGGDASRVLAPFVEAAHRRGWQVALWGASEASLPGYRALGLRTVCVGEEAFVDPCAFTLEGRRVRKLRQSVHRVTRRGWQITTCEGRAVDAELEAELDSLARAWRELQPRTIGFAMGMGPYEAELAPDDLHVLARSPSGELRAAMRFAAHCGGLSLDTMRRIGDTPNGLNEAMVCRALEVARGSGIREVSLNYAGLSHLVREPGCTKLPRWLVHAAMAPLSSRFQMERLVRFNEKFLPTWRRRYLVYESGAALPRTVLRVLQVEGYLPGGRPRRRPTRGLVLAPGSVARTPQHVKGAG